MSRRVLILGAGFSRAISDEMPLTDALGELVLQRTEEPPRTFSGGYFEAWLSRLAEQQPDLTDDINALNRMRYLQITQALHQVMAEREIAVLKEAPPTWLRRLVGVAHAMRMTIVTFNYDTLIEKATEMQRLRDWAKGNPVRSEHVIDRLPPLPPSDGMRWGSGEADTFRLLKLHGSLDYYWVDGDMSGATINRWPMLGSWGNPFPLDERERQRALPGRTPFIVPPAAAKSSFYQNPLTRQLWQTAAERLSNAEVVSLVGYSLPATDLVTSAMLAENLSRDGKLVEVVNREAKPVVGRLTYLGLEPASITSMEGNEAVRQFVDLIEREAGLSVTTSVLANRHAEALLVVAHGESVAGGVARIDPGGDAIRLVMEREARPLPEATYMRQAGDPLPMGRQELAYYLDQSRGRPLVAVFPNGEESVVIDSWEIVADVGPGDGRWMVLLTALPCPAD